jgi:pyrroloquinoline-quinone synthase
VVLADPAAPADLLTREEFTAALYAQGARYWDKHPFHIRLHAGGCTPDELRAWVVNRWYYQRSLSQKNGAIIANCPLPEVRRRWVERITFQDGRHSPNEVGDGEGGLGDWLALATAVNLRHEEMTDLRHLLPGVRFAVDGYVQFCKTKPWIEGAAAALTELFSPDLMADRILAWRRHYPWIDPAGYAYFEARIPVVAADSSYTLNLVLDHCVTRQQQEAAVAALAFKCDVLWTMLDAIEHNSSCGRKATW